jgi:tRNA modification GTPase
VSASAIYAPATPPGPASRAVLRLSGPGLLSGLEQLLPSGWPLAERQAEVASHGNASAFDSSQSFPVAMVGKWKWRANAELEVATLCFAAPRSATGEDVVELHFPGSAPVQEQLQAHLQSAGLRLAEPGEFTRRAFLNGKLDLAQAEAVLDLIHARNASEAIAAAAVVGGSLGGELQAARDALVHALVQLEAGLDFEEGDSQDLTPGEVHAALATARQALARGESGEQRRRVEQGEDWVIAMIGSPNAGKTTLFRQLTGKKALVSEIAGTTRDRLQATWTPPEKWRNQVRPWLLCDLPGLGGAAADPRDALARQRVAEDRFDLQLLLMDGSNPNAVLPQPLTDVPQVLVVTKCDLPNQLPENLLRQVENERDCVWISIASSTGLEQLADAVGATCRQAEQRHATSLRAVERHCQALASARERVEMAEEWAEQGGHQDLMAEEIRAALVEMGELVGEFTPEDLLDQLFGEFCVGK